MTTPTDTQTATSPALPAGVTALPGLELSTDTPVEEPRPGSRAARLAIPLSKDVLKDIAADYGVCLHPIAIRRIDTATGQAEISLPNTEITRSAGATRKDHSGRPVRAS